MISDGLEVTADEKQIDLVVIPLFQQLDLLVDSIEFTVTTAFDSNLALYFSARTSIQGAYLYHLHDRCL